jgi:nucleoside-diphosphate-sugar epimerase
MKKKILLLGSNGFIGQEIYKQIKNLYIYDIYRFSTKDNQFIDNGENIKKFDILIFAAGIHQLETENNNFFLYNKKILKALNYWSKKIKSCIFISSFKTSINFSSQIISENNKYNLFSYDSAYGKSKAINEKVALKIFKLRNIKFKIICPSHVIGPGKDNLNSQDIIKRYRKIINFIPKCSIPLIDVRDVAKYIKKIILDDNFDNKKIIINTINLTFKNYIKLIKKNSLFCFYIVINNNFLKLIYIMNSLFNKFFFKFNLITKFRYNYINSNIKTVINKEMKNNLSIEKSIQDVIDANIKNK